MSWIQTLTFADARGRLISLYERIKGPDGNIDNVLAVHSLRPHTLEGHMALYKNVLHHGDNTLEKWFLEALGVWVSTLNQCDYCVAHHYAGMRRLLADDQLAENLKSAFAHAALDEAHLSAAQKSALRYAEIVTRNPVEVSEADIDNLRGHGFDDGQILEINQVVAYFCYANRTVLGLGVTTEGDILGQSPGNAQRPDDWSHS